jgi:uncharacterized protein
VVADGASSGGTDGGRRRRATAALPRARRRRAPATAALTDRRRRVAAIAGGGTAALLAAAAGGATWYYADRITEAPGRRPVPPLPADGVQIRGLDRDEVVLAGPAAERPGWWGLATDDGWLRIGPPVGEVPLERPEPGLEDVTTGVRRPIELRTGHVRPGDTGRLESDAVPADPADIGWEVEDTTVPAPLGPLPAWWFPVPAAGGVSAGAATGAGSGRRGHRRDTGTVAVLVHGRSGSRREPARWVPTFLAAGVPCLAFSYRNAPGAPASPDGRSHLGATEWEDLEAAVRYAVEERGARDVVVLGVSMGGACTAELLRRSGTATRIRALVFDAPVRHWGPVLRAAARQRGLPPAVLPLLLPPTMALAGARRRIDWRGLDHLGDRQRFDLPTLLFHGDADLVVPVALSDAFAEARPDVVTYHRVRGAGHVRTWNTDRAGCEAALATFLDRVLRESGRRPLRLLPSG